MLASDIPSECLRDPQFIKVLTASLCSQIAESKKILAAFKCCLTNKDTDEEIQQLKDKVEQGLEKRKVLKQINKDLKQKNNMQDAMLESLERDGKNRAIELESIKCGLDDASLRQKADRAEYEKILNDYAVIWEQYKAAYEDFPLSKIREENRTTVRKFEIQLMIIEYKRDEFIKMLKQRKSIDDMRIRTAGVDIVEMVLHRWKDQKYLEHLRIVGKELRTELNNLDDELLRLQEEDEMRKLAEIETSKMPPPRLDFSFIRSTCAAERHFQRRKRTAPKSPSRDDDTQSVNTLILEEMCKKGSNEKSEDDDEKSVSSLQDNAKNISTSTAMIQVPVPTDPFLAHTSKKPADSISMDESNIHNKLQKLGIEIRNVAMHSEQSQYNNDSAEKKPNEEYADDGSEESFQRTRLWCEASRKEFAPYLLDERRSKSVSERMPSELNNDEFKLVGKNFSKALSSHGSEMKIASEHSDLASSKWSLCNDKTSAQQFQNVAPRKNVHNENFIQKSLNQVANSEKRKHQKNNSNIVETPTTNKKFHNRQDKSNDNAHQMLEIFQINNDRSEIRMDKDVRTTNKGPKLISVEKTIFPWKKHTGQTATNTVKPDYASSYMSSDNFSNFNEPAILQQTPRDSSITDCEDTPGYLSFAIGQNFSPHGAQSVASFISTIVDDQSTNEAPPAKEKSPVPAMNFGGFFGNKKKDQRSMF